MNIFILDKSIKKCAQYHCDQHVVKMILESVQIMCTALNKKGFSTPYKSTHQKHPCVLWIEESYDNFCWLGELVIALNDEYKYRFESNRNHKSALVLEQIKDMSYEAKGLTEFAQAMPVKYKVQGKAVEAYRDFYIGEKLTFARWTKRKTPLWIQNNKSSSYKKAALQ